MSWGVKAGAMRQLKLYPDPEVKTEVRASPFASARASSRVAPARVVDVRYAPPRRFSFVSPTTVARPAAHPPPIPVLPRSRNSSALIPATRSSNARSAFVS